MPWVKLQVKNNMSEFLILFLWKYMKCLLYLEILMLKWLVIFVTTNTIIFKLSFSLSGSPLIMCHFGA